MNSRRSLDLAGAAPIARFATAAVMASAMMVFFDSGTTRAASATWNSFGTDSNWATTTNWVGNPAVVPGTGDTATFGPTFGTTTISLGAGVTINTISYASVAAGYTIGSGAVGSQTLTLNHGGSIIINAAANTNDQLLNAAIVLGTNANTGAYGFSNLAAGRTLTFAGNITGGTGGTAGTKTLTVDSATNTVIMGVIGGGSGTIALTKTGIGELTLSGTNTFTGSMSVDAGTISVSTVNNASTAGPLGNSATPVSLTGTLEYTGGTASSNKRFTVGSTPYGNFDIVSAFTELTLSGIVDGSSGVFAKTGPGTLILTGANTYSGGTAIGGGLLKVSGAGKLGATSATLSMSSGKLDLGGTDQTVGGFSGSGTIVNNGGGASLLTINIPSSTFHTFSGQIYDNDNATAGTVALTKTGLGVLELGGVGSNYSGATLVTNGVLIASSPDALGSAVGGATVSSGATLEITAANIAGEPITISGTGESGYLGAILGAGTTTYGGLLKLAAGSTVAVWAGDTLDITNPGTIIGAGFTLTLTGGGDGSIASIIGTGSGGVIKNDIGKWTLSGANTYTGTTTINAGILNIQNANALGASTSSDTSIISGATLQIEGGITTPAGEGVTVRGAGATGIGVTGAFENVSGNNTWAGDVTLGADSTISSDSGLFTITNAGSITGAGGVGYDLTLVGAGNGAIASVLAISSGTVTKSGGGTWALSALNTYTGKTFIHGGTLEINTLKDVSGGSSSLGAPTTSVNGIIDIGTGATTGTLRFIGTADAVSNRIINLSGTTGGATIDSSSPTHNRILFTGAVAATFAGDKTLTLTGTSTGNNEFSNAIGDSSGFKTFVAKTGSGKWVLSAFTNSYTGDTSVVAGTLVITNAVLANTADVNLTTGAILNLTFAGSDTIDQLRINGVVQSPGTWGSLASSATYKTALITGAGILNVGSGAAQPPYESWAASYALSGADHPFDADPDRDAIDNGLEWILGGTPLAGSASILPQVSSDATYLFLTFNRNDGSESSSTLVAQWGAGLASWTDAAIGASSSGPDGNGVTITVTENGASPDTIVVSIPRTLGPQGQLFARLRATMP